MQDTLSLILSEVQSLRADYNTNARETGERLASLETSMYSLVGNGQPGRITLLERAVQKLQQWRWWVVGAAAGVSGVVSVVAWIVTK
jgi:hypothetical protein